MKLANPAIYLALHLKEIWGEKEAFEQYFFNSGWNISISENKFRKIVLQLELDSIFEKFTEALEKWEEHGLIEEKSEKDWKTQLKELYTLVKALYKAILALKALNDQELDLLGILDDADVRTDFKNEFPERLIEDIFTLTLQRHYPLAYGFCLLFGIIEYIEETPSGAYRVNYTRTNIRWERLAKFLGGPGTLFAEVYDWNQDTPIQWEKLLHNLEWGLLANGFLMRYVLPRKSVVDPEGDRKPFAAYVHPDYMVAHNLHELQLPFIYGTSLLDESFYNISLAMLPIAKPGHLEKAPQGLLFTPIIQGSTEHQFYISPEIALQLSAGLDASNSLAVALFPTGADLIVQPSQGGLSITLAGQPYVPWTIFGEADSHRLELHGFELALAVIQHREGPEVKLSFKATASDPEARGIRAVIELGDSDAFLEDAAQSNRIEAGLDLEIEWSSKRGFRFGGNADFSLEHHLNRQWGPIELTNFYLGLGDGPPRNGRAVTRLSTGLGLRGAVGPVQFAVENMGIALDLTPHDAASLEEEADPPVLGLLGIDLEYQAPDGIGFRIDASVVKGGGYLEFRDGEYRGYAELEIEDQFTLKAIAVITTELPDGQSGYSFLLVIQSEFEPITLGLGFYLNKVGGIIGLHRGLHLANIRTAVKTDTYDHILFSKDVAKDLPKIIKRLNTVMPIQRGHHAFGITAEIGWGKSQLLTIKAGLLLELPDWKIALVGVAKAEVTRKEKTLVRLQLNFAATYDRALFTFDGSLTESRLLIWDIYGDVAVRIRGGDRPYFLISAGGFHPDFKRPAGLRLPELKRLTVSVSEEKPTISADLFFAITSNTIQFGGSGQASHHKWGFGFEASLGFAALVQFNPLYFTAAVWGKVELYAFGRSFFGVTLRGEVSGPYPLRFSLYVRVKIWIFSKTVRIPTVTIGKAKETALPKVAAWPLLREQLLDFDNWTPVLPADRSLYVTIRSTENDIPEGQSDSSTKRLHPIGSVQIVQDQVPLALRMDYFGQQPLADYREFRIRTDGQTSQAVKRFFAPAQFLNLTEEERFESPAYEEYEGGVALTGSKQVLTGTAVEKPQVYEAYVFQPEGVVAERQINEEIQERISPFVNENQPVAPIRQRQLRSIRKTKGVALQPESYALINTHDSKNWGVVGSRGEAVQQRRQLLSEHPELETALVVVPQRELL